MVVKYGNRSPDISISEPVVDESDSVLQSTPAPSSTEDAGSRDKKAIGWKLISAEKLLRKSAVVVEALGTPAQNPREGEVEAAIRQLVGRGGGRRLGSARLCSPAARTVGGKKGELQLVEMRRVEKSYIIGGRRLWSAGPCSTPHEQARRRQEEPVCRPVRPQYKDDRRLQLLELCSPVTDKILQMNT